VAALVGAIKCVPVHFVSSFGIFNAEQGYADYLEFDRLIKATEGHYRKLLVGCFYPKPRKGKISVSITSKHCFIYKKYIVGQNPKNHLIALSESGVRMFSGVRNEFSLVSYTKNRP
jgi:hypothetical protein